MKKFISGILVGMLLMSSTFAFAETKQTIEAVFGQVKLVVNGKVADKETLLYNGTTYVPLRAAAELLDKEIEWDGNTQTAYIKDKEQQPSIPVPTTAPVASPEPEKPAETEKVESTKKESTTANAVNKDLPFRVGQIDYAFEILPKNSIGTTYMETWYSNRTGYTITYFNVKWLDTGEGRERFMSNSQYVKPGEISDYFKGFGPASGSKDDIELLETKVTFLNADGDKVYLTYNHNKDEYTVTGTW